MEAKANNGPAPALRVVTIPATVSIAPAPKLALAEKHIYIRWIIEWYTSNSLYYFIFPLILASF